MFDDFFKIGRNRNRGMATVTLNGMVIEGNSIVVKGHTIFVDGKQVQIDLNGALKIEILNGKIDRLEADGSVTATDCEIGTLSAGGSVKCDNVGGNVSAGSSVKCGDVNGSLSAGGSITAGAWRN